MDKRIRIGVVVLCSWIGLGWSTTARAAKWKIVADVKQFDIRGADGFSMLLKGNQTAAITGGGQDAATNAFLNPQRAQAFDNPSTTTSVLFNSSTKNQIGASATQKNHFGIEGNGKKPNKSKFVWVYNTAPMSIDAADPSYSVVYSPVSGTLTVTLINNSGDPVTVTNAGITLLAAEPSLTTLNSISMPPASFSSLPALNVMYQPGDSHQVIINSVSASQYVVLFQRVSFVGDPSSSNDEWDGVAVADSVVSNVPALSRSGAALLALGLSITTAAIASRRWTTRRRRLPLAS